MQDHWGWNGISHDVWDRLFQSSPPESESPLATKDLAPALQQALPRTLARRDDWQDARRSDQQNAAWKMMEDDVAEGQPGLLTRCARCCVKKKNAAQMTGGPGLYTPRLFVCVWCLSVHGVYVSLFEWE